jgi:hypothetical protein
MSSSQEKTGSGFSSRMANCACVRWRGRPLLRRDVNQYSTLASVPISSSLFPTILRPTRPNNVAVYSERRQSEKWWNRLQKQTT